MDTSKQKDSVSTKNSTDANGVFMGRVSQKFCLIRMRLFQRYLISQKILHLIIFRQIRVVLLDFNTTGKDVFF